LKGFGFDSFGTWYTKYRAPNSVLDYGPGLISDSPHNLFLDFGVTGGFPLLMSFLLLQFWTLIIGIKTVIRKNTSWEYKTAFVIWICFCFQSLISPGNLVLVFTGLVMTSIVLSEDNWESIHFENVNKSSMGSIYRKVCLLMTSLIVVTGMFASFKLIDADRKFRSALLSGEGNAIYQTSTAWPQSERRMLIASRVFYANQFIDFGDRVSSTLLKLNPSNVEALRLVLDYSLLSPSEEDELKRKIHDLDPYGKRK
jgi:hypothetical protein